MLIKLRKPIQVVGYCLVGLVLLGIFLTAVGSALQGQAFSGTSWHQLPIGTYTTLAIFTAIGVAGATLAVRWVTSRFGAKRNVRS